MATTPTSETSGTSGRIRVGGGQQGQVVLAGTPIGPPDLSLPLINEPAQPNPPAVDQPGEIGPLYYLIGTWTNQDLVAGKGGTEAPFSYNLMPLPQNDPAATSGTLGFILKNMRYYEEITFSPIHGTAANRGGAGTQVSNALLYEQRVYIADGPAKDTLVHFENGIWGFLTPAAQLVGPYGDDDGSTVGTESFGSPPPPEPENIFKQISVPHGNSVLATGNVPLLVLHPSEHTPPIMTNLPIPQSGAPTIPASVALPQDVPGNAIPATVAAEILALYSNPSVENPLPTYALNPNQALVDALGSSNVADFIQLDVDSNTGGGTVANISFEQAHAEVARYSATYWIEDTTGTGDFDQLQYSQTIMLTIPVTFPGATAPVPITFPHITVNTLRKGTGPSPAPAPAPTPTPAPTPGT